MPRYRLVTERHYNSEACGFSLFFEVPECEDLQEQRFEAEAQGLLTAIQESMGLWGEDAPTIQQVRETLRAAQEDGQAPLGWGVDEWCLAVWYRHDGPRDPEALNFGFGASADGTEETTDKHENLWLSIEPAKSREDRRAELQALRLEQLVELVLRAEDREGHEFA